MAHVPHGNCSIHRSRLCRHCPPVPSATSASTPVFPTHYLRFCASAQIFRAKELRTTETRRLKRMKPSLRVWVHHGTQRCSAPVTQRGVLGQARRRVRSTCAARATRSSTARATGGTWVPCTPSPGRLSSLASSSPRPPTGRCASGPRARHGRPLLVCTKPLAETFKQGTAL